MPMGEFDAINLIRRICAERLVGHTLEHAATDDAVALPKLTNGQYVSSVDTSLADVHFPCELPAEHIASRALLAALSDIAAMGGTPFGCLVALSAPKIQHSWLEAFAHGMNNTLADTGAALLGGNMTTGQQMSITTTVFGVCCDQPVYRHGATVGDDVYVTGTLGIAALGLRAWQDADSMQQHGANEATIAQLKQAFACPSVPFSFANKCAPYASAAIDISDGLFADMAHLAKQSQVSIELNMCALPIHPLVKQCGVDIGCSDEYQLCFSSPARHKSVITQLALRCQTTCTHIGVIVPAVGHAPLIDQQGTGVQTAGYQHQLVQT